MSLHDGKLYACYVPEVPDVKAVRAKFNDDPEKGDREAGQTTSIRRASIEHVGDSPLVTAMHPPGPGTASLTPSRVPWRTTTTSSQWLNPNVAVRVLQSR